MSSMHMCEMIQLSEMLQLEEKNYTLNNDNESETADIIPFKKITT